MKANPAKTKWAPQIWVAVFVGATLAACLNLTNFYGRLGITHWWMWGAPLALAVRVLFFPRLSGEPSSSTVPDDELKAVLAERDYIETVLNTRVNFLLTASAILGAAATQLTEQSDAALAYGLGACIAGLSIIGIDRSCAKLNFYLNVLHKHNHKPFKLFDNTSGLGGLYGSVFICTYALAVFILLAFIYLASR